MSASIIIPPTYIFIYISIYFPFTLAPHNCRTPKELLVYQTSSRNHIPFTFRKMATHMDTMNLWYSGAFLKNLWVPGCHYTDNRFVYKFLVFTKQVLPALFVDLLLRLCGRPPAIMPIMRKLYHTLEVMKPFMFNNYDSPGATDLKRMLEQNRK